MAIIKVVKFDGTPDIFAWKYPGDELSTWTQLIVNETQEAVLVKNGVTTDVFCGGHYTLDTDNIPILGKLLNLPFGGRSPFKAEVWFVNRVHSLNIKWGTATPIQLQDPKYHIFLPVRSFGQFGIRVVDSKKFLHKLVGTLPVLDKTALVKFFRGVFMTKVKDSISTYLVHKQVGLLEINAYLDEISGHMGERIRPLLEEYGIEVVSFYVTDISVPEDDDGVRKLKEALAKRAEMNIIGYDYRQERTFDTMEGAARNPGSGSAGVMGAGLGMGMGGAMGQAMADMAQAFAPAVRETVLCKRCGAKPAKGVRFCPECGYDMAPAQKPKIIKCNRCGGALDPSSKFCPQCGDRYNPCPNCGADVDESAAVCAQCGHAMPQHCPQCGGSSAQGSKYCAQCGHPLVKRCPNCNHEITGKSNFCHQCGQKLA